MDLLVTHVEDALRLLSTSMPITETDSLKPELFHSIRVGMSLYQHGCSMEIVVAGLLHDLLEETEISIDYVTERFGTEVSAIVQSCTKDRSITDSQERIEELIGRCIQKGEKALLVKTADILDSYQWYERTNNSGELLYCSRNANLILSAVDTSSHVLFQDLAEWYSKYPLS